MKINDGCKQVIEEKLNCMRSDAEVLCLLVGASIARDLHLAIAEDLKVEELRWKRFAERAENWGLSPIKILSREAAEKLYPEK